jgi:hypothetical protein
MAPKMIKRVTSRNTEKVNVEMIKNGVGEYSLIIN